VGGIATGRGWQWFGVRIAGTQAHLALLSARIVGRRGSRDLFRISLSNGYARAGSVSPGNVVIR
jgi:hypothetical protein